MSLRYSNSLFLEVLDPLPLENIGWTSKVLSEDDYSTVIAEVVRFAELQFQKEQSGVGGGSIYIDMEDVLWTTPLPAGQTIPIRDQQAIWQVYDDGVPRFAFFAEDVEEEVVKDGLRTCKISGRGIGACMEWAIVLPAGFPTYVTTDRTFTGAAMGGLLTLLTEAQARGEIDWVEATFTATVDSRGVPWTTDQTLVASSGSTLLDLLNAWCEQTGATWKMLPGFKLWVEQTNGNHREDTVVFSIGGQQVEHGKRKTRRDIANAVYASGADGISQVSDGTSISKWRRRSHWVEAGQAGDATARDLVAAATVRLLGEQKVSREVKVHPDKPGRRIFVDYDVADWLTIEAEEGDGDSSVVQVKAATIKISQNGMVELELSVGSRFDAYAVQVQRVLNKLGASSVSGTSSAVPPSTTTIISNTRLRELFDVNVVGAGAGDLLKFDGTNWVDGQMSLDDLTDVNLTGIADGKILKYDLASGLWKPATESGGGGSGGVPAWTQLLTNSDLPTLTGWTSRSGTWTPGTANGVSQTNSGSDCWLEFNTAIASGQLRALEATIRFAAGTTGIAGIGFADSGGWGGGEVSICLQVGSTGLWWDRYGSGGGSLAITIATATDYVFKVFRNPSGSFDVYVDGSLVWTITTADAVQGRIGLYTRSISGTVYFKKVSIWSGVPAYVGP